VRRLEVLATAARRPELLDEAVAEPEPAAPEPHEPQFARLELDEPDTWEELDLDDLRAEVTESGPQGVERRDVEPQTVEPEVSPAAPDQAGSGQAGSDRPDRPRDRRFRFRRRTASTEALPQRSQVRALLHVAVGALLIAGVIVAAPRVPDVVDWGRQIFAKEPPTTVGTVVKVSATTSHPAVEVLAGTPVPAQATDGAGPAKGQHLVAVPLRLHNVGTSGWNAPLAAKATVLDNLGVAHPVAKSVRAVAGYPLLAGKTAVAPGQETTGYVVFSVPDGRTLRSVTLGLTRASDESVTWQVGS
jgi:hypothetical protein